MIGITIIPIQTNSNLATYYIPGIVSFVTELFTVTHDRNHDNLNAN